MKKHLSILILLVLICAGLAISGCKTSGNGSGKMNITIGDDSNNNSNKVTATKIVITSAAKNVMADAVSSAINIEAQDASGNVATGFSGTVNLTPSTTTMKFGSSVVYTDTLGTLIDNVTSVTLSAGKGSFYFKDTKAGSPTITVSSSGVTSASQTETISCTAHTHCSSTEICKATICETALNRVYRVTVKDASLNLTTNSIDANYSNPDPYVGIFFPDMNHLTAFTSTKVDTLTPLWNEYAEVTVTADGQSLWFCMGDEDDPTRVTDDSLYFSGTDYCKGFNNILDFIRIGEASLSGTSDVNYLNVSIEPK